MLEEEEEMSEGEIQKQLEREEYMKVKRAVAAAKVSGELARYNSLKHNQKTEEETLEGQIMDLNTGSKPKNVKITQKRIMTTSMIDKKNIILENMSIKQTINQKNIEIETTKTTY